MQNAVAMYCGSTDADADASLVQNTVYLCTQIDCGTEESFCCGCCSTNPRRVPVGLSTPRCDDDGVCVVHSRWNLIASSYRSNERASRAVRRSLFIGATKIPHRRGLGMASRWTDCTQLPTNIADICADTIKAYFVADTKKISAVFVADISP